jgi:hypothetical protein
MIGPKEQKIVSDGSLGVRMEDVAESDRELSSLSDEQVSELARTALEIEALYGGLPQDIEWAYSSHGSAEGDSAKLHLLQSRPITNLPVQPIDVEWVVPAPGTYVSRRQIVENMPDPICPLFEELYLTEGLESTRKGKSMMVGGGPMFMTVNGYAYMRFDFQVIHDQATAKGLKPLSEAEIDAAEHAAEKKAQEQAKAASGKEPDAKQRAGKAQEEDWQIRERDVQRFREDLSDAERGAFDAWVGAQDQQGLASANHACE